MKSNHYSLDLDLRISEGVLLDEDSELSEFDTFTRPEELLYFLPPAAQQRRSGLTFNEDYS